MATIEISRSQNNNLTRLYMGNVVIWFSYETPVAFHIPGERRVVSENVWSNTTGRHLAEISPDKSTRIPHDEFERRLGEIMIQINTALAPMSEAR